MGDPCRGLANLGSLARVGDLTNLITDWYRQARKDKTLNIYHHTSTFGVALYSNLLCHRVIANEPDQY